jgi:predicted nucleic acid-binding Zn ribbon protein
VSNCPSCGQAMPEGTVTCGSCRATLNSQSATVSDSKLHVTVQGHVFPNSANSSELSLRLEKAMRRTELLSYAAAGLAVAILAVILLLSIL